MSDAQPQTLRRAVALMTVTSFLIPFGGVITAPILARALSTDGRGELAAAIAPAGLMLAAATLGLPDALTYYLAKHPRSTRRALLWSSLATVALGLVCLVATILALPFLSAGSPALASLILLATILTVPALIVNVLRGAATGRQMWRAVAIERVIVTGVRIVAFTAFFIAGQLTVLVAVLINVIPPMFAGLVYVGLLLAPRTDPGGEPLPPDTRLFRMIVNYGSKVWLGSVASMLLARASQLLMTPLSNAANLGLYSVASTISDLPLVVALAIQGALFGVNSKTADAAQLTATSRLTILAGTIGCAVMGVSLPFWIGPLFGDEFRAATVPTIMLLFSALLCIPGLMAATALSAWGRPGLRSVGLAVTLVANVGTFVLLVPPFGVYGAAWTSVVSNVVMTTYMIAQASRITGVKPLDFVLVRGADVRRAIGEVRRVLAMLQRRRNRDREDVGAGR